MKSLTRVFMLLLAVVMLLSAAACGDKTQGGGDPREDDILSGAGEETTPAEGGPARESTAPPTGTGETPKPAPSPTKPPSAPAKPSPVKPSPESPSPGPADPTDGPAMSLTYDEAFAICADWLDAHDDLASYEMSGWYYEYDPVPPATYCILGQWHYEFFLSSEWNEDYTTGYVHRVLVNEISGELLSLFRTKQGGESWTETVELLDDWYNGRHFSFAPALLSAFDAVAAYEAWVEQNENVYDYFYYYPLNSESYNVYRIFGDQYYYFYADDEFAYWFNILVHMETGELLFMLTGDGMYPETVIEPLEDWFGALS